MSYRFAADAARNPRLSGLVALPNLSEFGVLIHLLTTMMGIFDPSVSSVEIASTSIVFLHIALCAFCKMV